MDKGDPDSGNKNATSQSTTVGADSVVASDGIDPAMGADTTVAITTVALVAGAISNVLSGPIGVSIIVTLALANVFLPIILDYFKTVSNQQGLNIFATIDDKILQAVLAQAAVDMTVFQEKYDSIKNMFNQWQNGANETIRKYAKVQLQHAYIDLTHNGISSIRRAFTRDDYGGFMLAQLVTTSARYLAAMKDFYTYAEELELAAIPSAAIVKVLLLAQLREGIKALTNMAINSYRLGEQNIIQGKGGHKRSWDDLNNYRTTATITGLDLLPAFQYLDPEYYPNGCHRRDLNRTLLSFLNTSTPDSATQNRGDMMDMDRILNRRYGGAYVLDTLRLGYAYFSSSTKAYVDGAFSVLAGVKTIDGYDEYYQSVHTTKNLPFGQTYQSYKYTVVHPCRRVGGTYTSVHETIYGTPTHTCMTALEFRYLVGNQPDRHMIDLSLARLPAKRSEFSLDIF